MAATNIPLLPNRLIPTRGRFAGTRAISALMLREMSTTYGRSPGGYLWAILEPVAAVALLSFVFSYALQTPPIGNNFSLFYATGYLILSAFNGLNQKLGIAIRFSKPLLAYPKVSYMDAVLARFVLNALTQALVIFIVLAGIILVMDLQVTISFPRVLHAFLMLLALSFGVGVLNCFLISMFPVWQQIWSILTRPLFIISGIFFLIDNLPESYRDILLYNPLAHVIMQMRSGFYATYDAPLVSAAFVYLTALICAAFGLLMLRRYHRTIVNER